VETPWREGGFVVEEPDWSRVRNACSLISRLSPFELEFALNSGCFVARISIARPFFAGFKPEDTSILHVKTRKKLQGYLQR